jgi:hypothetical protein
MTMMFNLLKEEIPNSKDDSVKLDMPGSMRWIQFLTGNRHAEDYTGTVSQRSKK